MRSRRRGTGSDIAGSRPYRPGDSIDAIDWAASARVSTATGADEFVVRERFTEDAPKVVVVCDRRPQMSSFPSGLPWLDKPRAAAHAVELVLASAAAAGGFAGYLDHAAGSPYWRQPRGERKPAELGDEHLRSRGYRGQADWLERSFEHLAAHTRAVPAGTFVFVVSDFVPPPAADVWLAGLERRWDLVPIVLQDPTWEQSFPDVSGIVVPLRDPRTGRIVPVRLTKAEARARRAENESRLSGLLETFRLLEIDPILLSSAEDGDVLERFLVWTELRRTQQVVGV
jgi:uncharacterized protein (DUF58 family)